MLLLCDYLACNPAYIFLNSIQHTVKTNCLKENVRIHFSKHEMTKWISRLCCCHDVLTFGQLRTRNIGKDWKS